jgi:hypothetical protein
VTFQPLADGSALYLTRTHPLVAAYCDRVLGKALGPEGDDLFPRSGAIFTDAVNLRTAILLLRLRYILRERSDEFAEEVVLAAYQRQEGRPMWLQPWEQARELLEEARPVANMPQPERAEQVRWALDLLGRDDRWFDPVIAWRVGELQASNDRLRALTRAGSLQIGPHRPPDILGCYVLVPGGARRSGEHEGGVQRGRAATRGGPYGGGPYGGGPGEADPTRQALPAQHSGRTL